MISRWVPGVPHCHAAAPGTFGHECGKTATWIGGKPRKTWGFAIGTSGEVREPAGSLMKMAYCEGCKAAKIETEGVTTWEVIGPTTKLEGVYA